MPAPDRSTAVLRSDPPDVTFRPMVPTDVAVAARLERESYSHPWSEGIFRDCLRVGYECQVVVDSEGEVGGYGIMSTGAGEAHLLNVCVREDLRRRGVGRRTIELLLGKARACGMNNVFLEVRPTNANALRLYQALGFEQIGIRKGYYPAVGGREDAVQFKLDLTAVRLPGD